ncbi:hypothetical protein QR685DRAFT_516462 [Neurospora intermedia]|uniref:Uncharacterized protein n=1 Tax=Neurospora intermedia TaxID=5142 RepID=A0ABR3DKX0_NEUIN
MISKRYSPPSPSATSTSRTRNTTVAPEKKCIMVFILVELKRRQWGLGPAAVQGSSIHFVFPMPRTEQSSTLPNYTNSQKAPPSNFIQEVGLTNRKESCTEERGKSEAATTPSPQRLGFGRGRNSRVASLTHRHDHFWSLFYQDCQNVNRIQRGDPNNHRWSASSPVANPIHRTHVHKDAHTHTQCPGRASMSSTTLSLQIFNSLYA